MHTASHLIDAVKSSSVTMQQAQDQTLAFLKKHCQPGTSPLCGNSVWQDRTFLAKHMPKLINFLYYRIIDVSTIKELVSRWYPNDPDAKFNKKDTHRALEDIRESIAELKHYRKTFFV